MPEAEAVEAEEDAERPVGMEIDNGDPSTSVRVWLFSNDRQEHCDIPGHDERKRQFRKSF